MALRTEFDYIVMHVLLRSSHMNSRCLLQNFIMYPRPVVIEASDGVWAPLVILHVTVAWQFVMLCEMRGCEQDRDDCEFWVDIRWSEDSWSCAKIWAKGKRPLLGLHCSPCFKLKHCYIWILFPSMSRLHDILQLKGITFDFVVLCSLLFNLTKLERIICDKILIFIKPRCFEFKETCSKFDKLNVFC